MTSSQDVVFKVAKLPFNPGRYHLTVVVYDKDVVRELDHLEQYLTLKVVAKDHNLHGKINLFGKWSQ
jgi:hypothetical protein